MSNAYSLHAFEGTRTEFYWLAHNTNTSRSIMVVTRSMCNTGSKCKIISCIKQKLLQTWSSHDKSSLYLPEGTEEKSTSQIVTILESEGRRTSHATVRKWVNQTCTTRSAPLWMTKQDYSQNSCLYEAEDAIINDGTLCEYLAAEKGASNWMAVLPVDGFYLHKRNSGMLSA